MAIIKLPGGTDVAEMALFDVASLPQVLPANPHEAFAESERAAKMLRFPMGGDGGYLLHAYVDEPVPDSIRSACLLDEKREGFLTISGRRIGFGGIESCCQGYGTNDRIRADSDIEPGDYRVSAYMARFPDEPRLGNLTAAMERFSAWERFLAALPAWWVRGIVVVTITCLIWQQYLAAFVIALAGAVVHRWLGNARSLRRIRLRIEGRRQEVDLQYPDIVVEMRRETASGQPK